MLKLDLVLTWISREMDFILTAKISQNKKTFANKNISFVFIRWIVISFFDMLAITDS